MLGADSSSTPAGRLFSDLRPRSGHFPGAAKAVIQLVQNGGPSQMDLFDPKPELTKRGGQPHPDGVEIHQPNNHNVLLLVSLNSDVTANAAWRSPKHCRIWALSQMNCA